MKKHHFVASFEEAKASIDRYESALAKSVELQAIMSYVRSWYGYLAPDGAWKVAPSKFAGYVDNSAEAYLRLHRARDGRRTERVLSAWFEESKPGSAAYEDITAAVQRLFARHGRAPNKLWRVNVPIAARVSATPGRDADRSGRSLFRSRITFDSRICGGRPCIRGMRIRVTDILDMLSAGATRQEILADYPYLEDADISAALEYAAESADHRVVSAA